MRYFLRVFDLLLSFTTIAVQAQEPPERVKYDLNDAVESLQGTDSEGNPIIDIPKPQHLPGVDDESLEGDAGDVTVTLQKIANGIAGIASGIAIFMIIFSAFKLVTAVGNSDDITKAKKGLTWSIVGLILIIAAFVIVKTIIYFAYTGEAFLPGV